MKLSKSIVCITIIACMYWVNASADDLGIYKEDYEKIKNTKLFHLLNQKTIKVRTQENLNKDALESAVVMYIAGPIGVLAMSNRETDRLQEASGKYIQLKTTDHDVSFSELFNKKVKSKIEDKIKDKGFYSIELFNFKYSTKENILENNYKHGNGSILILESYYYYNDIVGQVRVVTYIDIYMEAKKEEKDEFAEFIDEEKDNIIPALYSSRVMYVSEKAPGNNPLEYWANGDNLKNTLMEGIEIVSDLVVLKLLNTVNGEMHGESDYWQIVKIPAANTISGELLYESGDREVVKLDSDVYVSLPKGHRYREEEDEEEF